jgi:hypothetical protein
MPPSSTDATGPSSAAVAPDSNSPSWLLAPMKTELTALTRPRMSSGVSSCTSVWRMTTLTMSAAPPSASAPATARTRSTGRTRWSSARTPPPRPAAAAPVRRRMGQRVSAMDITSAPTAGAARSRPRPDRPDVQHVLGEHRQQRGGAAQQHREQVQRHAPSTTLWLNTKCRPATSVRPVGAARRRRVRSARPGPPAAWTATNSALHMP